MLHNTKHACPLHLLEKHLQVLFKKLNICARVLWQNKT